MHGDAGADICAWIAKAGVMGDCSHGLGNEYETNESGADGAC